MRTCDGGICLKFFPQTNDDYQGSNEANDCETEPHEPIS